MYLARHHRRGSRGMGTHQGFPEYHSLLESHDSDKCNPRLQGLLHMRLESRL